MFRSVVVLLYQKPSYSFLAHPGPCILRRASHRIASHHIASHRIASHRIESHRIVLFVSSRFFSCRVLSQYARTQLSDGLKTAVHSNTSQNHRPVCPRRRAFRSRIASHHIASPNLKLNVFSFNRFVSSIVACMAVCPVVRRRLRRHLLRRVPSPARHLGRPLQGPQYLRALRPRRRRRGKPS